MEGDGVLESTSAISTKPWSQAMQLVWNWVTRTLAGTGSEQDPVRVRHRPC